MNVAVPPDQRRQGIASRLIEHLFEEAGPDGALHARGADLEPRGDRDVRALRLPPAGHRRRYYHDNGEDALIMWLEAPTAVEA